MNFYTSPQNKGTIIPPSRPRALHSEPSQETETHGHALVIWLSAWKYICQLCCWRATGKIGFSSNWWSLASLHAFLHTDSWKTAQTVQKRVEQWTHEGCLVSVARFGWLLVHRPPMSLLSRSKETELSEQPATEQQGSRWESRNGNKLSDPFHQLHFPTHRMEYDLHERCSPTSLLLSHEG